MTFACPSLQFDFTLSRAVCGGRLRRRYRVVLNEGMRETANAVLSSAFSSSQQSECEFFVGVQSATIRSSVGLLIRLYPLVLMRKV